MSQNLLDLFTDTLQQKTLDQEISWYPASREDSPAVRRQFELNRNEYGIPSPEKVFLCDMPWGRMMLMQIVKTFEKGGGVIRAEYDYKLLIQPDCKGEYVDLSSNRRKVNQILNQIAELTYCEEDKVYSDGLSARIHQILFSILGEYSSEK